MLVTLSRDGRAACRVVLRRVIRWWWSSLLLTTTGHHRPTTSSHPQPLSYRSLSTSATQPARAVRPGGVPRTRWPFVRACGQYSRKGRRSQHGRGYARRHGRCRSINDREQVTFSFKMMDWLAVHACSRGCWRVVSCPILDTAGLALRPPCGGSPFALAGFGSARRSVSFLGCVTSTNNHQRRNKQ
jgi:hypothetical protein